MPSQEQDAWVAAALGMKVSEPAAAAGPGAGKDLAKEAVMLSKLADVWHATEAKVHKDVDGLLQHLKQLYGDDPAAAQMEKDFQVHFDQIAGTFDGTLGQELAKAASARDAAEMTRVKAEMKATVGQFVKSVEADPTVALMDGNPFVPMQIGKTCSKALEAMLAHLG